MVTLSCRLYMLTKTYIVLEKEYNILFSRKKKKTNFIKGCPKQLLLPIENSKLAVSFTWRLLKICD